MAILNHFMALIENFTPVGICFYVQALFTFIPGLKCIVEKAIVK
jgi:hypothetical protein